VEFLKCLEITAWLYFFKKVNFGIVWQISVDDFLGSRPAVDIGVEMNRGSCSP
jgi:hypothetical protein